MFDLYVSALTSQDIGNIDIQVHQFVQLTIEQVSRRWFVQVSGQEIYHQLDRVNSTQLKRDVQGRNTIEVLDEWVTVRLGIVFVENKLQYFVMVS